MSAYIPPQRPPRSPMGRHIAAHGDQSPRLLTKGRKGRLRRFIERLLRHRTGNDRPHGATPGERPPEPISAEISAYPEVFTHDFTQALRDEEESDLNPYTGRPASEDPWR